MSPRAAQQQFVVVVVFFSVTLVWQESFWSESLSSPPLKVSVSLLLVLLRPWWTEHVAITFNRCKNAVVLTVIGGFFTPSRASQAV